MPKNTKQPIVEAAASNSPIPAERIVSKAANFFSVYANDLQVFTSPWDLRLVLGEMGDQGIASSGAVVMNISQLGEVRMSPQIAKKLIGLLADQLKAYETSFGQIPGPPD